MPSLKKDVVRKIGQDCSKEVKFRVLSMKQYAISQLFNNNNKNQIGSEAYQSQSEGRDRFD